MRFEALHGIPAAEPLFSALKTKRMQNKQIAPVKLSEAMQQQKRETDMQRRGETKEMWIESNTN